MITIVHKVRCPSCKDVIPFKVDIPAPTEEITNPKLRRTELVDPITGEELYKHSQTFAYYPIECEHCGNKNIYTTFIIENDIFKKKRGNDENCAKKKI